MEYFAFFAIVDLIDVSLCVTEYMLSTSAFPELLRLRQKCSTDDLTKLKTSRFKCSFSTQGFRNVDDVVEEFADAT